MRLVQSCISLKELPIIRLVDKILREAINEQASDIHLESYETTFRVRYRIDGLLHDFCAAFTNRA